jgi:hypothetical protein
MPAWAVLLSLATRSRGTPATISSATRRSSPGLARCGTRSAAVCPNVPAHAALVWQRWIESLDTAGAGSQHAHTAFLTADGAALVLVLVNLDTSQALFATVEVAGGQGSFNASLPAGAVGTLVWSAQ